MTFPMNAVFNNVIPEPLRIIDRAHNVFEQMQPLASQGQHSGKLPLLPSAQDR